MDTTLQQRIQNANLTRTEKRIADYFIENSGSLYFMTARDIAQELGISSVRGGGIVGDHDVLFCGPEEVVTISHVAQSRGVFADGAVQAALFLDGCEPGYYTMTDMLKGKMQCL